MGSAGGPHADRPKRQRFTAAYKMEILTKYDKLTDSAERGALLRREGLWAATTAPSVDRTGRYS